jgi:serine/threonine protein kinase
MGVILYELCMLTLPFKSEQSEATKELILKGAYKPLRSDLYSIKLNTLIGKCLSLNLDERITTSDILKNEII